MPVPHGLDYYFLISYEIGKYEPLFFFRTVLAILGLLYFHINVKISFICVRREAGILIGIILNL